MNLVAKSQNLKNGFYLLDMLHAELDRNASIERFEQIFVLEQSLPGAGRKLKCFYSKNHMFDKSHMIFT